MDDDYAEYFEDAEILAKLVENLDHYFHMLVVKYKKTVFGVARSILDSPEDAEEAAVDTFVQAYYKLLRMRDEERDIRLHIHPKPWLSTIARNISLNRIRGKGRSPPGVPLSTNEEGDPVEGRSYGQSPSAEDEAVQREKDVELYNLLGQLSEHDYKIIYLYYFIGLSDPQIARLLKKKKNTVKKARHRALERFRKITRYDIRG